MSRRRVCSLGVHLWSEHNVQLASVQVDLEQNTFYFTSLTAPFSLTCTIGSDPPSVNLAIESLEARAQMVYDALFGLFFLAERYSHPVTQRYTQVMAAERLSESCGNDARCAGSIGMIRRGERESCSKKDNHARSSWRRFATSCWQWPHTIPNLSFGLAAFRNVFMPMPEHEQPLIPYKITCEPLLPWSFHRPYDPDRSFGQAQKP